MTKPKSETTKTGKNLRLKPDLLSEYVNYNLLRTTTKDTYFSQFCVGLGNDFDRFINKCQNFVIQNKKGQLENSKKIVLLEKQRQEILTKEIEILEKKK
jgi:hypothetical protein